ncbi:thiamine pyrophosphate-dependent enzyme [Janibacter cremeus]|uniref:thiamine pyrophosphate-dependent enzyme n=1 Tax=Janibacter cremeus TaxID=1285192 RepID=UPI0023F8BAFA|nr:thiamine pyrophosphate-dependent enzyme [Janibacter cremeus]WEV76880.1 thiamine pyrophosphate-dependent enzyme [Janibacter cremeus]
MSEPIDTSFTDGARSLVSEPGAGLPEWLAPREALGLFESQLRSRHLDLAARWLRGRGEGFYTIGSSGHEGNAAVAAALRPTDPALLHYRSGGFYVHRATQVPDHDAVRDVLLGLVGAASEPISGGRHKVFGHHDLAVIPQTSTIASHLPRAMGVAFSLARASKLGVECSWPEDSVVVCSFGDASANHSTAVGAINAAIQASYQGLPMPLLFVCEDNGIGISVQTPKGWIETAFGQRPGLAYFEADGCDLAEALRVSREAAHYVRTQRKPAFLHLGTVRLMGHAGSDVESAYRRPAEIADDLDRDPLLATARLLVSAGTLSAEDVVQWYESVRQEVRTTAEEVIALPKLSSAAEVMTPLAWPDPDTVAAAAGRPVERDARLVVFGKRLPEDEGPLTVAQAVNRALLDGAVSDPGLLVFGEDVARKGGVYGVTRTLQRRLGPARVFDTVLDEQSILGVALGAGVSGLLPVPEIQYLAYLHNAEDQLRGEAATLPFFSEGQYTNPMVVRVAGYGYQKGFGGHFHNDNALGVLLDIPGLVVASPSRPDDAAAMMRTCLMAARTDGATSVFLEPIALYHTTDLYEPGDGEWAAAYPTPGASEEAVLGRARTYGQGDDLTIVTFGNGLHMSLRVAATLAAEDIHVRVVDLRWLRPLPVEDILREANETGRVLVVDETRRTGGVSEGVVTALVDGRFDGRIARVTSDDSFIPLGDAALTVLLSEETVEAAARDLLGNG